MSPARRLPASRATVLLAALAFVVSLGAAVRPATAALLPFLAPQMEVFGGVVLSGGQIWVDADMDGVESGGDTYHPIPNNITVDWDLSLSPTYRIMTAVLRNSGGPLDPSAEIRVFAIPRSSDPLIERGTQKHLNGWPNPTQFFDPDTTAPYRTALFVEVPNSGSSGQYLWWDLVTGAAAHSLFPYLTPYGFVEFAPSGTMAFVQHDVNGPGGTNYSIVKLCPVGIGQASQNGLEYPGDSQGSDVLHAFLQTGGSPFVVEYREDGGLVTSVAYEDCQVSDPLGSCCLPAGGCEQRTQGGCGQGSWTEGQSCQAAGCAPPPAASLAVALAGPASVTRGAELTYTLTASNNGNLAAGSVTVSDRIPFGSSFTSASGGGTYNGGTGVVTWSLGTLGPSSQTQRTLTVQTPCFGGPLLNDTYSITGTPGGTVPGSPAVSTSLVAPVTTSFTLTLLSQALATPPLQTGNRVRYTVRMANGLAEPRPGLTFSINSGSTSRIAQVVDAGGGSAITTATNLTWTGDIPASATVDVVYETEISECRAPAAATESFNNGAAIFVRNNCNVTFAFAIPTQSFAVAPSPFQLRLESTSHGPAQTWYYITSSSVVVCRPADLVTIEARFINASSSAGPGSTLSLTLPAELVTAADPPFAGSPPAGAAWDANTRTISWSGTPAANDSVRIAFNVSVAAGSCRGDLGATGSFGACNVQLTAALSLAAVPVPPQSHLLQLRTETGLWFVDPSVSSDEQGLLCGSFAQLNGLGRTPDGTLWVAGNPTFRLNPQQLTFKIFPSSFRTALGMDFPNDAAGDPRDSSVVFTGYQSGFGLRLRRYDPDNGQISVLLNDSGFALGSGNRVTVGTDGLIGVVNGSSVVRVPPLNPTAYQIFTPPGGGVVHGLDIDTDGNWLTTLLPPGGGSTRKLSKVDVITGVYTTLADLGTLFSGFQSVGGVAVEPDLDVHMGSSTGELAVLYRQQGNVITSSMQESSIADLMWIGPAVTVAVEPSAGSQGSPRLRVESPVPNPARGGATLRFGLPTAAEANLGIYDLQGRCVRRFEGAAREAGVHTLRWDGRDDAGARLGAGLYFLRLTQGGRVATARITLMR